MIKEKKRKEFGEKSMVGLKSKEGYIKHVKKGINQETKLSEKKTCNQERTILVERHAMMGDKT